MKTFKWIEHPHLFTKAQLIEKNNRHYYQTPEGMVFPSVTTMLGKVSKNNGSIRRWRESVGGQVADFIVDESKKNGTATHSIIEKYLNNQELPELALLVKGHFTQIQTYLDRIDNITATEIPLYSYSMRLAGTCDCIAEYNGIPSIIDFKTSRKRKKEEWIENYFLQATAYSKMWHELTGNEIEQIVILISSEDGSVQEFVKKPSDFGGLLSVKLKEFEKLGGYEKN